VVLDKKFLPRKIAGLKNFSDLLFRMKKSHFGAKKNFKPLRFFDRQTKRF
jgi:hypothetical protein